MHAQVFQFVSVQLRLLDAELHGWPRPDVAADRQRPQDGAQHAAVLLLLRLSSVHRIQPVTATLQLTQFVRRLVRIRSDCMVMTDSDDAAAYFMYCRPTCNFDTRYL